VPDDALQLGIRVLRHYLSEVWSHDASQEGLVNEDSALNPLSMAAIIATVNGRQSLTLGRCEGVGRKRYGGGREVVGLPSDVLGEEIDEGRSAQREDCQCSHPEA
jgi:hypothetical protein